MTDRYPGYDVLAKRWTPSWDETTRAVIDRRLAVHPGPRFFSAEEWSTLQAICARILPQSTDRPPVPLAAYVDERLFKDWRDGYRHARMPPQGEAWRRGLAALDAGAEVQRGRRFHQLEGPDKLPSQDDADGRPQASGLGRHALQALLCRSCHPGRHPSLLRSPDRLERDRLWWPGKPARLCANGLRPPRSLGSGRSTSRACGAGPIGKPACGTTLNWRLGRGAAGLPTCSMSADGFPCGNTRRASRRIFAILARGQAEARRLPPRRNGLLGRGLRRWAFLPPARGLASTRPDRPSSTGPTSGLSTGRTH